MEREINSSEQIFSGEKNEKLEELRLAYIKARKEFLGASLSEQRAAWRDIEAGEEVLDGSMGRDKKAETERMLDEAQKKKERAGEEMRKKSDEYHENVFESFEVSFDPEKQQGRKKRVDAIRATRDEANQMFLEEIQGDQEAIELMANSLLVTVGDNEKLERDASQHLANLEDSGDGISDYSQDLVAAKTETISALEEVEGKEWARGSIQRINEYALGGVLKDLQNEASDEGSGSIFLGKNGENWWLVIPSGKVFLLEFHSTKDIRDRARKAGFQIIKAS